ncbi:MAG: peptidoglycan-binding protein [Aquamicrobium sp.]|uniref:peptidoglycan-binding protein n=1 Tax=Aquamicrobium sp. TaxID=1872579 RepID=UPI00349E5FD1|nr:peptidoglycan-binding protein [Aquamicrobium sp.]
MRDRRSYLDSVNAGRRRRDGASLDAIDMTLDQLEGRLGRAAHDDGARHSPAAGRQRREAARDDYRYFEGRDRGFQPREEAHAPYADTPRFAVSGEMRALREELHGEMTAGLRREFAALKGDIERALRSAPPAGQAAELGAEFERLSSMIHRLSNPGEDRQVHLLRTEMEEMKKALGHLAREETLRSFDRRFRDMAGTLASSRGTVDPEIRTLAARIEEIGSAVRTLPTTGALRSLEEKMRVLQDAVERFSHEPAHPDTRMFDALEDRLDEISRAVAAAYSAPRAPAFDPEPFERIEARISSLARQMDEAAQDTTARDLGDQLAALSHRVEDLAHRVDLPERAIERLAGQIGAIADRLDHAPALPNLDAVFHGLENRLASMSNLLEQRHEDALAQGRALFHDLETRIDEVAARIETDRPAAGSDDAFISAMDARFAELAARFERQAAAQADSGAIRDLEKRLDTISTRIESSVGASPVDPDLIRSLEAQIAGLADHISHPAPAQRADDIQPRLDKIEQSIAASRADVVEAARRAAEDAVRNFSGTTSENALVAGLADDLKSLEALTRKSDDRNAKTFEAIHDTLLKIVDRLGAVENASANAAALSGTLTRDMALGPARTPSLSPEAAALPLAPASTSELAMAVAIDSAPRTAQPAAAKKEASPARGSLLGGLARKLSRKDKAGAAAQAAEAPAEHEAGTAPSVDPDAPLDPQLANQPLEPGSGAPDLGAIMRRVRDERAQPARGPGADASRADFIAAARRAAQAAAAEAERMKRTPAGKEDEKASGLGGLLKNRRKPLLMGIAAILIALAALQGSKLFLGKGGANVASAPAPAAIVAAVPTPEAQAPESGTPAPQVRMAGEPAVPASAPTAVSDAGSALVTPPQTEEEIDGDWLDLETTAAAPAREETVSAAPAATAFAPAEEARGPQAATEIDALPQASEKAVAAIPLEAGPVALREAAAGGDPKALYEIGNRYAEGRGVAADPAKAAEWYGKAAEDGLAPAQYRLGSFYEKGIGVGRDIAAAKKWYAQAAEAGNASAMHNLAVLHAMDAQTAAENETAARWFMRAAELGVRDSQFNLGILSAKGVGMPQNLQEAYKWFALVAKAGDKDAAEKRDEVARALRPEQLETARAAAELWRAKELDAEANHVEIPESWGESQDTTAGVDMRAAVRNIQKILNKNGYQAGGEDGLMGQKTKTAIAAFQKDNGMTATGEVDEALVRALLERR